MALMSREELFEEKVKELKLREFLRTVTEQLENALTELAAGHPYASRAYADGAVIDLDVFLRQMELARRSFWVSSRTSGRK